MIDADLVSRPMAPGERATDIYLLGAFLQRVNVRQ